VAEALDLRKTLEHNEVLTPAGSTKKLVEMIGNRRPRPGDLLLVGHEPYLSQLISLLVTGDGECAAVVMKKGGLCKLSAELVEHGRCASFEWLLTPKQMSLMA
jgi:phosphohistidine phosphatase